MFEQQERRIIPFDKSTNLRLIDNIVDKSLEKLRQHYNTTPTGSEFDTFVNELWQLFPTSVHYDAVFASVMTLAGTQLTREVISKTAWRLAANISKLKRGEPVPPWIRQTELEWAAIKIVRAQLGRSKNGRAGFWYDYRVLTGQPAGLRFRLFWSIKYARFVAKSSGFPKSNRSLRSFKDGNELVGILLYLLFDPELSTDDGPGHYHFYIPPSCKTSNIQLLKLRSREIPCPQGFLLSEVACHKCPFGYDECPAGTHPFTYAVKPCPRCSSAETWFDTIGRSSVCIECEEKEVTTRKIEE